MAGRPQQILHGGTLKYLFGYFKIRILYCSNRSSDALVPNSFLLLLVRHLLLVAMHLFLIASCYY